MELLLGLFDAWEDDPHEADARYVLALLLVRKRVFRVEREGARVIVRGFQRFRIVEILSEGTARIDRREKFLAEMDRAHQKRCPQAFYRGFCGVREGR